MVDIVVNHNGWNGPPDTVDYSKFNPFNREEHYNTPYCEIDYNDLGDTVRPSKQPHSIPLDRRYI